MQTQDQNGSANAGNPQDPGAGTGGGTGGGGEWWAGLQDVGNRTVAQAKGWKTADDPIRSYTELERKFTELSSSALTVPGADATPEQREAFLKAIGRPDAPEGYGEFAMPDGLPADMPYTPEGAARLKNIAHKLGLDPARAQLLHNEFVGVLAEEFRQGQEARAAAQAAATEDLGKVWGQPGTAGFNRNVELADRAIRNLGGSDLKTELTKAGLLGPSGEVHSPAIAKMLAKVGAELYAEDTVFGGPQSIDNPWSDKSFNLTKQGELIRKDPSLAKALIEAAGLKPSTYRL